MERTSGKCEDCARCTIDPETGEYLCTENLDEDEMEKFSLGRTDFCSRYLSKSKIRMPSPNDGFTEE